MAASNRQLSVDYLAALKQAHSDISHRLSTPTATPENLKAVQVDLVQLRKALVAAEEFLPRYDQRQADGQLKELEARLESVKTASTPKSRFAFKKKVPGASPAPPPPTSAASLPSKPPPAGNPSDPLLSVTPPLSQNVALSSLSSTFVRLPSTLPLVPAGEGYSVSLSSISNSIISLFPPTSFSASNPPITALHIRSLHRSILVSPPVRGSILVHGAKDSLLVVGGWQVRMHDCRRTSVLVRMGRDGGTPVVEGCEGMSFGPYILDEEASTAPQLQILDFSHPNPSSPSPNVTLLDSASPLPCPTLTRARSVVEAIRNTSEESWTAGKVDEVLASWRQATQ